MLLTGFAISNIAVALSSSYAVIVASRILGGYVDVLRKNEKIGPLFQAIQLTDIARKSGDDSLRFEIKFTLKERK